MHSLLQMSPNGFRGALTWHFCLFAKPWRMLSEETPSPGTFSHSISCTSSHHFKLARPLFRVSQCASPSCSSKGTGLAVRHTEGWLARTYDSVAQTIVRVSQYLARIRLACAPRVCQLSDPVRPFEGTGCDDRGSWLGGRVRGRGKIAIASNSQT